MKLLGHWRQSHWMLVASCSLRPKLKIPDMPEDVPVKVMIKLTSSIQSHCQQSFDSVKTGI
jgi:hypothetical protein